MFYLDLFAALDRHRVRYILVGGVAVNLYGIPRMTMDVDLVLALDLENLETFFKAARELNLKPQAPLPLEALADPEQRQAWREEKHMIAFALYDPGHPGMTVDILIDAPLDIAAAIGRAVPRMVGETPVMLAAAADLIRLKEHSAREQDIADIEQLRELLP
ncbi:hypothetical protein [Endothiovibrio diazotrophicus]